MKQSKLTITEKETLKTLKGKLEAGLPSHYSALAVLAPTLPPSKLTALGPHRDPIRLPSHLTAAEIQEHNLQSLAKLEVAIRVAHGREWIEKIKTQLGVRSFTTRYARQTHGTTPNTRAQKAVRRAEAKVVSASAVYKRNWERLSALDPTPIELKGLKELHSSDLKLLGTWLEEELYKKGAREKLPWFWSLQAVASSESLNSSPDELAKEVQAWNEESKQTCCSIFILNLIPLFYLSSSSGVGSCQSSS